MHSEIPAAVARLRQLATTVMGEQNIEAFREAGEILCGLARAGALSPRMRVSFSALLNDRAPDPDGPIIEVEDRGWKFFLDGIGELRRTQPLHPEAAGLSLAVQRWETSEARETSCRSMLTDLAEILERSAAPTGRSEVPASVFTPPSLAERWGCKSEAVRALLESGALRGFRVGGKHWRIPLAAVEAYERGERQASPESKRAVGRRQRAAARIDGPF